MLQDLLDGLAQEQINFSQVLAYIDAAYNYTPTAFQNGVQRNAAGENQGSAKVFSFAQIHQLSAAQTLSLFAEHYQSVLHHPDATDHQNIRQFMQHGWSGIQFEASALTPKA